MSEKKYQNILVIAEQRNDIIQPVSFELLSQSRELAKDLSCAVYVLILGHQINECHAKELNQYGADKVFIINDKRLNHYSTEVYTKLITQFINTHTPEIVLIGASSIGRDLAPRLSARLKTGLTADCTQLEIDPDTKNLLMTRPAFGGNILATIVCPNHRPQMSTVRPGVLKKERIENKGTLHIEYLLSNIEDQDINIEILDTFFEKKEKKNIEEANILISAGRGIGKQENLKHIQQLSEELGAMVSGSRAVVDAGWIDHASQVGQTGKTVRPEVYFACGISGAIQHVAGMEESELIIAINNNPGAPIFQTADLGLIGDVNQILPYLIEEIKKEKTSIK